MTALDLPLVSTRVGRGPRAGDLSHIPGENGWPVVGRTFELLADFKGFAEKHARQYGLINRSNAFGAPNINLLGPEGNEFVLLDSQKLFSSSQGWDVALGRLFPRGLMLLDFDEHRAHRRALAIAFKAGPMRSYLAALDEGIRTRVEEWRSAPGPMLFYPAMKQLTLDLAATAFLGGATEAEMAGVRQAFVDMVAAAVSPVRRPLPGTQMRRGLKGRAFIVDYFSRQIPLRREAGGDDLFSHLCRATNDEGALLSTEDIVNHMSFLMMAAHDTLTSSVTSLVWFLAADQGWQERLRAEVDALDLQGDDPLPFEKLEAMPLTEMAFKEAMRINPPVPSIPRRALRAFEFGGYHVPAGTHVNINLVFTHHMPEIWPEPDRFDPLRFTAEAQAARHRFAWVPYSGGAHMCIGLHFANMQAKCFTRHLLQNLRLTVAPGYAPAWQILPIPKPKDGLNLRVSSRR